MISRISSELLAQLTPVLGSLARLMASQQSITAEQLSTLLLGVELEGESSALDELERWYRLLDVLRRNPTPGQQMVTVEALCLRGLPEATARLAVSTVVDALLSAEAVTTASLPLKVGIERLDFGTLQLGQSAKASFEVEGGPGEVVVESDRVQVQPERFGAQGSMVQVTVQPPAAGNEGTLWTKLKILSAGNTLEIPLVAEWRTQPDEGHAVTAVEEGHRRAESGFVTLLAPETKDGAVQRREVEGETFPRTLGGHTDEVNSVAWSPDGRRLASASDDKTVRVWDAVSGTQLAVLQHEDDVWSVAWSPDGRRLASAGGWDGMLRLWDAVSGTQLAVLEGHTGSVNSVAWSPDGRQLASAGGRDKTVRLWDADRGAQLAVLEGHTRPVLSVAWSPDGRQLASGSWDVAVRLWDAASGAPLAVLKGHMNWVLSVAWSPDGRRLVSGSRDGRVRLWDADRGASLAVLKGHTRPVLSVAWSPDGRQLASGSCDKTVRLWDADSRAQLAVLQHEDEVNSVAWSPDGRRLVSGSKDGTVQLWNVTQFGLR